MSCKASYFVIGSSIVLLAFGIAQIVIAAQICQISNYSLGNTWLVGLLCSLFALRGIYIPYTRTFKFIALLSIIPFISSILGSIITGTQFKQYKDIQACASTSSIKGFNNCDYPSTHYNYHCVGNSKYYRKAAQQIYLPNIPNQCSCISSDYFSYDFNDMKDCNIVLTKLPHLLEIDYALSMVCLFITLLTGILATIATFKPQLLGGNVVKVVIPEFSFEAENESFLSL